MYDRKRSDHEYYLNHKDKFKKYRQEYDLAHKEERKKQNNNKEIRKENYNIRYVENFPCSFRPSSRILERKL